MYRYLLLLVGLFLLAGCGANLSQVGRGRVERDKAQAAAEEAFVELEGGKEVPLPGMSAGVWPITGWTERAERKAASTNTAPSARRCRLRASVPISRFPYRTSLSI